MHLTQDTLDTPKLQDSLDGLRIRTIPRQSDCLRIERSLG